MPALFTRSRSRRWLSSAEKPSHSVEAAPSVLCAAQPGALQLRLVAVDMLHPIPEGGAVGRAQAGGAEVPVAVVARQLGDDDAPGNHIHGQVMGDQQQQVFTFFDLE